MSATATAIAASAAASAAAANSAAINARKRAECQASMPKFSHETATVEARQEYAACVGLIHPQTMGGPEVVAVKLLIVLTFIGAGVGFVYGWRTGYVDRWIDATLLAFIGAIAFPSAAVVSVIAIYAGWWLFQ